MELEKKKNRSGILKNGSNVNRKAKHIRGVSA